MQPRFTVGVLVLQAERVVSTIRYLGFLFQTTPAGVVAEPQELAVLIGHLARDADLVAVEVVGLLAAFSVFCDHQRRKTQNYRLIREAPAGLFAEPNLFTLEQYRLLIIFIHP